MATTAAAHASPPQRELPKRGALTEEDERAIARVRFLRGSDVDAIVALRPRPPPAKPEVDENGDAWLTFQLTGTHGLAYTPRAERDFDLARYCGPTSPEHSPGRVWARGDASAPSFFVFGRTAEGASVAVRFAWLLPRVVFRWEEGADAEAFLAEVQSACDDLVRACDGYAKPARLVCHEVVRCGRLYGFDPDPDAVAAAAACGLAGEQITAQTAVPLPQRKRPFLALYVASESDVGLLKRVFGESPLTYERNGGDGVPDELRARCAALRARAPLYESRLELSAQLIIRAGLKDSNWVRVPWSCVQRGVPCFSSADVEAGIELERTPDGQRDVRRWLQPVKRQGYAPLVQLSLDIENVTSRRDAVDAGADDEADEDDTAVKFPDADVDDNYVTLVTGTLDLLGTPADGAPPLRAVFTILPQLGSPAGLRGALELVRGGAGDREPRIDRRVGVMRVPDAVVVCADEAEMLAAWRAFVVAADPDIMMGWNVDFDMRYMALRAQWRAPAYAFQARLLHVAARTTRERIQRKAYGDNKMVDCVIPGRIVYDMMLWIKDLNEKMSSFALESVSSLVLGVGKVDMPPSRQWQIAHAALAGRLDDLPGGGDLARVTAEDVWTYALYNVVDTELPLQLAFAYSAVPRTFELSAVCAAMPKDVLTRGTQLRSYNLNAVWCDRLQLVMDYATGDATDSGYDGAFVLDPIVGLYLMLVVVLDFSSLYPSMIEAHNLAYNTIVRDPALQNLPGVRYVRVDVGDGRVNTFVHRFHGAGVNARIVADLVAARRAVRRELATCDDPFRRKILDGRQLALKICANASYGFTGVAPDAGAMLPMREIAESTTAMGRASLMTAVRIVHDEFPPLRVLYGDTDSVMVLTDIEPDAEGRARGWELATRIAARVVEVLRDGPDSPIDLAVEKVCTAALFEKSKRYALMQHDGLDKPGRLNVKGLEMVKRDFAPVVHRAQRELLDNLLRKRSVRGAELALRELLSAIVEDRLPVSDYTLTKSLKAAYSKGPEPTQLHVARRMCERRPGMPLPIGDRIAHVMIEMPPGGKRSEAAEDPAFVEANRDKMRVDRLYYIEQIERKLADILRIVSPDMLARLFPPVRSALVQQRSRTRDIRVLFGTPTSLFGDVPEERPLTESHAALSAATEFGKKRLASAGAEPSPKRATVSIARLFASSQRASPAPSPSPSPAPAPHTSQAPPVLFSISSTPRRATPKQTVRPSPQAPPPWISRSPSAPQ